MSKKTERREPIYILAEKCVRLEDALKFANNILNNEGFIGVLPNSSSSFRSGKSFHARVNRLIQSVSDKSNQRNSNG